MFPEEIGASGMFCVAVWPLGMFVTNGSMFGISVTISSVPFSGISVVYDHTWCVCIVRRRRNQIRLHSHKDNFTYNFKQMMENVVEF